MRQALTGFLLLFFITSFAQQKGISDNDGVDTYYRVFGKGYPILIINGGPGMNSNGFAGLATKLASHFQAIIYDQRGTGRSLIKNPDNNSITMQLMVSDIETLRKKLGIEHWIVLGHSFGGMLASLYAAEYPGRIDKLILSSSGGIDLELLNNVGTRIQSRLSMIEKDSLNYWNKRIAGGDTSYHARLRRGFALAPAYLVDRKYIPIIAERLTEGNARINSLVFEDMQKTGFNCATKLASFEKPVLIIQGREDILEESIAQKAMKVFKHANLIILEHSGHYGWLDNEKGYFDAIYTFTGKP